MLVFLKTIVYVLIFVAMGILAYQIIPFIINRYLQIQRKRMENTVKSLNQIFVFNQKPRLLFMFTFVPIILGILGFMFMRNPIGAVIGVAVGSIFPTILIKIMAKQRISKFSQQIVDGLMLFSSSLKAGMSLNQGFEVVVEELPPPISEEFAMVIRENQMGVPLDDCLDHLKERMPVPDLDLITTSIGISRETGGDLTEIFAQLVRTIREKKKLENRVRSLTVQGKLQGIIMSLLPIVFAVFLYMVNPANFQIMFDDELGQKLLVLAVVLEVIGLILIKKLSKVEV